MNSNSNKHNPKLRKNQYCGVELMRVRSSCSVKIWVEILRKTVGMQGVWGNAPVVCSSRREGFLASSYFVVPSRSGLKCKAQLISCRYRQSEGDLCFHTVTTGHGFCLSNLLEICVASSRPRRRAAPFAGAYPPMPPRCRPFGLHYRPRRW